jgi:hypothetical protein
MSAHRRRKVSSAVPPLLTDWPTYEQSLHWMERLRALMEGAGVWTVEFQAALGSLAGAILIAAAGRTGTVGPVEIRAPNSVNGHRPKPQRRPGVPGITLQTRLAALGYAPIPVKADQVRLGRLVAQAYKAKHGRMPSWRSEGQGEARRRLTVYEAAALPLVDAVLYQELGEPAKTQVSPDEEDA